MAIFKFFHLCSQKKQKANIKQSYLILELLLASVTISNCEFKMLCLPNFETSCLIYVNTVYL